MKEQILKEVKTFIKKIKAINNRTEDKIIVLKKTLQEYNTYRNNHLDFLGNSYQVEDLINSITIAQTKRKNVSKKSLHDEFSRTKELALFRLEHIYIP